MHRNEVVLAGRLSMEPAHRELPSGALLTRWRLAVRRPGGRSGHQRSDAIECATLDDVVRDMLAGWQLGDLVEVEGALRRRWWRGSSRYEIEVRTARRVEAAVPRSRPRRRKPHADDGTVAETGQADHGGVVADAGATEEAASGGDAFSGASGHEAKPGGLPAGSSGGQAVGAPATSSCDHQNDAVSAEPADEVINQWRRSA
ncbi:single-stranded DNA-binding protein [Microbispora sp. NEAU-D428]|uniref:single-stranded DNA-binding protein n=1 Tax=Microbispora sitophila TaxID=2771537 RepID=UPI001866DB68|nr:single-stranded DNA-binding protein [Microbispora sitophila]MBE3013106.1 single-stranded DNA-binding protein [Microbispora sitophila]